MSNLTRISDYLKKATVAIEDRNFYNHHGISISGMLRAMLSTASRRQGQLGLRCINNQPTIKKPTKLATKSLIKTSRSKAKLSTKNKPNVFTKKAAR
ncbi:transglycosylase domain-containing protein [Candidatus Minimicrobia naudis]|uniref:Transglycosylase domain-containing protein n=1 Tax=Candidatus Minimicrobia naudis TaxID=2841263 RepID=A0A8F1MBB8_9BACT|nr:transglycosylase domain-containing protein [Candidatus Minimicrobia naudis]